MEYVNIGYSELEYLYNSEKLPHDAITGSLKEFELILKIMYKYSNSFSLSPSYSKGENEKVYTFPIKINVDIEDEYLDSDFARIVVSAISRMGGMVNKGNVSGSASDINVKSVYIAYESYGIEKIMQEFNPTKHMSVYFADVHNIMSLVKYTSELLERKSITVTVLNPEVFKLKDRSFLNMDISDDANALSITDKSLYVSMPADDSKKAFAVREYVKNLVKASKSHRLYVPKDCKNEMALSCVALYIMNRINAKGSADIVFQTTVESRDVYSRMQDLLSAQTLYYKLEVLYDLYEKSKVGNVDALVNNGDLISDGTYPRVSVYEVVPELNVVSLHIQSLLEGNIVSKHRRITDLKDFKSTFSPIELLASDTAIFKSQLNYEDFIRKSLRYFESQVKSSSKLLSIRDLVVEMIGGERFITVVFDDRTVVTAGYVSNGNVFGKFNLKDYRNLITPLVFCDYEPEGKNFLGYQKSNDIVNVFRSCNFESTTLRSYIAEMSCVFVNNQSDGKGSTTYPFHILNVDGSINKEIVDRFNQAVNIKYPNRKITAASGFVKTELETASVFPEIGVMLELGVKYSRDASAVDALVKTFGKEAVRHYEHKNAQVTIYNTINRNLIIDGKFQLIAKYC